MSIIITPETAYKIAYKFASANISTFVLKPNEIARNILGNQYSIEFDCVGNRLIIEVRHDIEKTYYNKPLTVNQWSNIIAVFNNYFDVIL